MEGECQLHMFVLLITSVVSHVLDKSLSFQDLDPKARLLEHLISLCKSPVSLILLWPPCGHHA